MVLNLQLGHHPKDSPSPYYLPHWQIIRSVHHPKRIPPPLCKVTNADVIQPKNVVYSREGHDWATSNSGWIKNRKLKVGIIEHSEPYRVSNETLWCTIRNSRIYLFFVITVRSWIVNWKCFKTSNNSHNKKKVASTWCSCEVFSHSGNPPKHSKVIRSIIVLREEGVCWNGKTIWKTEYRKGSKILYLYVEYINCNPVYSSYTKY